MPARILKINRIDQLRIHCTFNTGEYRVVDLEKFVEAYDLRKDETLRQIQASAPLVVKVKDGTLTFPYALKEISLRSGKKMTVAYDLDPVMLYDVSEPDEEMTELFQIGHQLRQARKQAGLTQEQLANRVGTSKGYISRIENNRTDVALKTLRRIIEVGLEKRLLIADRQSAKDQLD